MSYKALDVAKYIIEYTNSIDKSISNLKLQKLLYYVQANCLVKGTELFEDELVHWEYGPVVKSVYKELRIYGKNKLDKDSLGGFFDFNDYIELKDKDKDTIQEILKNYLDLSAYELVDKSHNESPWLETNYNEIITKGSIQEFFLEEIYGF
jgi:uncharacterized phage-associated protein